MKKLVSLLISVTMIIASAATVTVSAMTSFIDLPDSHWAYNSVNSLVSSGTINGYDDGTFLPDSTVTRAEFVKMLGKSQNKREMDFADVPKDYWGYEEIMYSGLDGDDANNFKPDEAITRNDVVNLLYFRFASNTETVAPHYITGQGTSPKAVAWVYNCGLLVGDDMISLRLADSLTRAEAAVLIVRAQNLDLSVKRNFIDNFSDSVYENVYNTCGLFDSPYNANDEITNGEVALASLRLQFRQKEPPLGNYEYSKDFDGKYAREWSIMTNYVFNNKYKCTAEDCDKNATIADAMAMTAFCVNNNNYIKPETTIANDEVYPNINVSSSAAYKNAISYAYNFGISLYADSNMNFDKQITKKELACMIMQYDMEFGSNIAYRCGYLCTYEATQIRYDANSYPKNRADFSVILNEIPNIVYETPFDYESVKEKCIQSTDIAKTVSGILSSPLIDICSRAYNRGINIYITYYPSLFCNADNGYIYRVKLEAENVPDGTKLSDIFTLNSDVADVNLSNGGVYYVDVLTNANLNGIYLDANNITIGKVIGY